jgi:hypothetical protein
MKMRPPVDFQLASSEKITPASQAGQRDAQRCSVVDGAQSAPAQRFDVHRPERLHRLTSLVAGQPKMPFAATLAPFLTLQFRFYLQGVCVDKHSQPSHKRRLREPVLCAIAALRQTAPLPRLDVNRPPFASGFVLEMFRTHRRFSNAAENPIWNDSALSGSRARFGRLHNSHGWQDKSPDVRRGQVVGWIESFAHSTRSPCWRAANKVQRIQSAERHQRFSCGRPVS